MQVLDQLAFGELADGQYPFGTPCRQRCQEAVEPVIRAAEPAGIHQVRHIVYRIEGMVVRQRTESRPGDEQGAAVMATDIMGQNHLFPQMRAFAARAYYGEGAFVLLAYIRRRYHHEFFAPSPEGAGNLVGETVNTRQALRKKSAVYYYHIVVFNVCK